ncbi:hypothetical protein WAF17_21220 [Bernardetia sp. ABR2-2B]|uniref:hypothetical protein n=1 Tax=Bernardetia sp. ABR2-2B TaxID=3127472 RepID=UPI0030D0EC54
MKYLFTIFLSLLSFLSYSQQNDSLLYVRCRNFQTISDSSLSITVLSKTEVKIWKDTTHKNTLFIEPKEEGIIKLALTNSENDTVQVMNYKAVLLPSPTIELRENGKNNSKKISVHLSRKNNTIIAQSNPPYNNKIAFLIGKEPDLWYRANNFSAYLEREGKKIDSVLSENSRLEIGSLIEKV